MAWYDEGYWAFEKSYHGDAVARQYLEGIWTDPVERDGYVEQADPTHPGRTIRGVTLEQARSGHWDAIICSLSEWPEHLAGFRRLAGETGAILLAQVGNVGAVDRIDWSQITGALISSTTPGVHVPVPHVIYRQEFALSDFRTEYPAESNSVASFIQCFPENHGFYDEFLGYARNLPEFAWKVYGAYGSHPEDGFACGNLPTTPAVAEAMRRTRIAWHAKWWSDGYGHVIHNLYATGRPVLAYHNYYADKLAGPLLEHGMTGFDLSRMDTDEIVSTLRRLRDDDDFWREISENAEARFHSVVNFDADAIAVHDLIESLL